MTKKEKYKEAIDIIKKYNEELNSSMINDYICCKCEKNIISKGGVDNKNVNPLNQENLMWNNGGVGAISFGFGSKYDLNTYYVGICDECLKNLINNKLAINVKNFSKK